MKPSASATCRAPPTSSGPSTTAPDGKDGYVSLEVNPHLARDTAGTIEEARRLWAALDRPNVFIKVPGHGRRAARHPATHRRRHQRQRDACSSACRATGRWRKPTSPASRPGRPRASPSKHVASVASFFVSRIDTLVDPLLEKRIAQGGSGAEVAEQAHGQVAVASAKHGLSDLQGHLRPRPVPGPGRQGARPQRLLWASTGTKNPDYSDVKYVEALIGPDTVNTAPLETLDAYRDHGDPQARLEQDVEQARWVLERLPELGIDIDKATQQLEDEGVEKFNKPFDKLMETLAKQ